MHFCITELVTENHLKYSAFKIHFTATGEDDGIMTFTMAGEIYND
jgi:hypothetical protein